MKNKRYISELIDVLKIANQSDRSYLILTILKSIAIASMPFVYIVYSAIILDALVAGYSVQKIMLYVFQMIALSGFMLILSH